MHSPRFLTQQALYSPTVTLTLNPTTPHSSLPKLYTLLLTDLDHPDPATSTVGEWCHWLVTNIPLPAPEQQEQLKKSTHKISVTLPGGTSPYLQPALSTPKAKKSSRKGIRYHPSAPAVTPQLPGNVVLPYVPPHPPNQAPKSAHRYVLVALEQTSRIDVDVEELIKRRVSSLPKTATGAFTADEDEGEKRIMASARAAFSVWGFAKEHGMDVSGYAFFRSSWNVYTPAIYARLGE